MTIVDLPALKIGHGVGRCGRNPPGTPISSVALPTSGGAVWDRAALRLCR